MNIRIVWRRGLGMVVAALLWAGGNPREAFGQATNTAPVPQPDASAAAAAQATTDPDTALGAQTEAAELADAAIKPISSEKPLPPSIKLTGPVTEVIKLVDSGVDESVIMALVTNSTRPFNLGVEEIIYLNDIGVSGSVVTAMMQRDQALKELPANAGRAPAAPAPGNYAPQPAAASATPETAPEAPPPGNNATESYPPAATADAGYAPFYDSLAPYGTWVDVAGCGPCWQPTVVVVNPSWRPYCDAGRWVYTDCGWYWLSGYSWGWAPFHYGRWFQHHRLGWCWAPDRVWGPSWVCWRYTDSHCGWAPLPPGAWFRPGFGLTFHGRHVGATFGFGLGVNSFAFVDVNRFRDPHLNRHALPHQQAARVFSTTAASATIAGHNNRVINHGIPVGRVAAATRTEIHQVAIHDVNAPAGRGAHGERFEGNSRTMSVFRPQFPAPTGTQPGPSARPRSELRNGGSGAARVPDAPRVSPALLPRAVGGTTTAKPDGIGHFGGRAERPATGVSPSPTTAHGSTPTTVRPTIEATPRVAAPLILHGPDRSGQATGRSGASSVNPAAPARPPMSTWRNDASPRQSVSPSPKPAIETSRLRPTTPPQENASRPTFNQRPHPMPSPVWQSRAPSESAGSAPRALAPPVRSETPRPSAPSYQAPIAVSRVAPAPAPMPSPRPSFSTPAMSSTPRMQAPAAPPPPRPAPSAPAASAPAPRSQSSSDKRGR
jgi:hypothetical protein